MLILSRFLIKLLDLNQLIPIQFVDSYPVIRLYFFSTLLTQKSFLPQLKSNLITKNAETLFVQIQHFYGNSTFVFFCYFSSFFPLKKRIYTPFDCSILPCLFSYLFCRLVVLLFKKNGVLIFKSRVV